MQHFLVNNGIYIYFCLIMGRINTIVLLNEYKIMMCIWNYISLHRMDQMIDNQESNFVHNV
jgi:hypothetical protein